MGWLFSWLVMGSAAFALAIVNLIRALLKKEKGWQALMFASLSCGALSLLDNYRMVGSWLAHNDISALYDVVPSMSDILPIAVILGLALNLAVLLVYCRQTKKSTPA